MLSTMTWNFQNDRRCHETAKMLKKIEKHKNNDTCKEHHPHIVERDKPKISKSVGQTFPQLPWKQKRGIQFLFGFLSSNFIKL